MHQYAQSLEGSSNLHRKIFVRASTERDQAAKTNSDKNNNNNTTTLAKKDIKKQLSKKDLMVAQNNERKDQDSRKVRYG